MSSELRACLGCGWEGYDDKITFCHSCKSIYHKCPKCEGSMKVVRNYALASMRGRCERNVVPPKKVKRVRRRH